jgi:hypothetical protein
MLLIIELTRTEIQFSWRINELAHQILYLSHNQLLTGFVSKKAR